MQKIVGKVLTRYLGTYIKNFSSDNLQNWALNDLGTSTRCWCPGMCVWTPPTSCALSSPSTALYFANLNVRHSILTVLFFVSRCPPRRVQGGGRARARWHSAQPEGHQGNLYTNLRQGMNRNHVQSSLISFFMMFSYCSCAFRLFPCGCNRPSCIVRFASPPIHPPLLGHYVLRRCHGRGWVRIRSSWSPTRYILNSTNRIK